ncbi:hypothetical protein [Persephonella sp.]
MGVYVKKGFGFGLTSGVITTLGMLIGLATISESKTVIIGGIISIAIADAASDALGIHIAEESHEKTESKNVWTVTVTTFVSKFIFSSSFLIPVALLDIKLAVAVSLIWGFLLLIVFSYKIAIDRNENPLKTILEHTIIATIVLFIIHITGDIINRYLGNG